MRFFIKRKLLDSLEGDRWARVRSTGSVKTFKRSERVRSRTVKTTMSSLRGAEMGAIEVTGKTLPEELVEKSIAMMPYPSLFKARLLSKAWLARFKPISFLETEEEKRVAISFQKIVGEWSINWNTFGPVCVIKPTKYRKKPWMEYTRPVKESIVFNHAMQNWQSLPPRPFLHYNTFPTKFRHPQYFPNRLQDVCYEGPLVYGEIYSERDLTYVGNILTRECKHLPARPQNCDTELEVLGKKLIIDAVLGTYMVIVLCAADFEKEGYEYYLQTCNSKSRTWKSKDYKSKDYIQPYLTFGGDWAVLNGVLYIPSMRYGWNSIWAFNLAESTLDELRLSSRYVEISTAKLVTCNGKLVMIVTKDVTGSIRVYEIDLASLQLLEVARHRAIVGQDVMHTPEMIKACFTEADCMFFKIPFRESESEGQVAKYNMHKDQWSFCDVGTCNYGWSYCNFKPGLNPLIAV